MMGIHSKSNLRSPWSYIFITFNVLVIVYLVYSCCCSGSVEDELRAHAARDVAYGVDRVDGSPNDDEDEEDTGDRAPHLKHD